MLSVCTVEPNPHECAALTSLNYNIGLVNLKKSSVLKAHNRGDKQAAARAFGLWVKAGGTEMPGLVKRRSEEAALYLKPWTDLTDDEELIAESADPISQVVEPERPMTQSQITRAGAVAGGTAAIATVAETLQTVNAVKSGVEGLEQWLVPVLLATVVFLCGYVVYQRYLQRSKGWA